MAVGRADIEAPGWRSLMIGSALLVALVLASFLPSLDFEFVNFDDPIYVVDNPRVSAGLSAEGVRWAFSTFYGANWFPLTWLSWMLDASLFGMDARAFHASGVVLHGCATLLLFVALARATGRPGASAFVAAVFAVHPLHVESVVWVSARKDTLCGVFFILAILIHCGGGDRPTPLRRAILFTCALAALMAKPTAVVLPFVLMLLDAWPLGRLSRLGAFEGRDGAPVGSWNIDPRRLRVAFADKLEVFVLVAVACVVFFAAQQSAGVVVELERLPFGSRVANALVAYATYLGKTVWPSQLAVIYPHPGVALPLWQPALAAGLLTVLTAACLRDWQRAPALLVGWLWFLGALVPASGIVQVGSQALADRYMYLPLIGLAVAVAFGLPPLVSRGSGRSGRAGSTLGGAGVLLGAAVVLALCITARLQAAIWHDSVSLFEHTLAVTEDNPIAHAHLGAALLERGRPHETVAHYSEAIRLSPDASAVANNFAWLLATASDAEIRNSYLAVRLAERAVAISGSRDPGMLDTLAAAYASAGRFEEAATTAENGADLARQLGRDRLARGIESRLDGYRQQRPHIQPGAPRGE